MSLHNLRLYPHTKSDIADNIEFLPWLQDLEFQDIFQMSGYFKAYSLEKGQVLFEEGSHEAYMVIVYSGRVDLVKETSNEGQRVIGTMREGKVFGELSLLDHGPRSAGARARKDTIIYALSSESFNKMQVENPKIALLLALKICKIVSQRLRQTTGQWVELLNSVKK